MNAAGTVTIKEAAREFQVSEKTIRRYLAQKLLPSTQVARGAVIRIPRDAWNRFIEGRRR